MRRKFTKAQLTQRVAERAVEFYRAQGTVRRLRERLNNEYTVFFQAAGEPDPKRRRIDPSNPIYAPVIAYTADSYELYQRARQAKHSAKRRMETAIRALIGPDARIEDLASVARPQAARGQLMTPSGETLQ